MDSERLYDVLLDAILERRFPNALAIDPPVMKLLRDEARFYASAVMAAHAAQRQEVGS